MKKFKGRTNLYYRMDFMYSMRSIRKLIRNNQAIKSSHDDFLFVLSKLNEFNKTNKYQYKKNKDNKSYRNRIGVLFEVLLPLELSKSKYEEFATKTLKYLLKEDYKRLPFFVFIEKRGRGNYLSFFIIEREYFSDGIYVETKTKSDIYKDKVTHAFCKSSSPNAYLFKRKGTVTSSKTVFFSNKVQTFMIGNNPAKKYNLSSFRKSFLQYLENTFISMGVIFSNAFFMHGFCYRNLSPSRKKGVITANAFLKSIEKRVNSIEEGLHVVPYIEDREKQLLQNLYHYVENSLYLSLKKIYFYELKTKKFFQRINNFINLNSPIFKDLIMTTEINIFESFL